MKDLFFATLYTCLYLTGVSLVVMAGYQIHQHGEWLMMRVLSEPASAETALVLIAFAAIVLGYVKRSRIRDWLDTQHDIKGVS